MNHWGKYVVYIFGLEMKCAQTSYHWQKNMYLVGKRKFFSTLIVLRLKTKVLMIRKTAFSSLQEFLSRKKDTCLIQKDFKIGYVFEKTHSLVVFGQEFLSFGRKASRS